MHFLHFQVHPMYSMYEVKMGGFQGFHLGHHHLMLILTNRFPLEKLQYRPAVLLLYVLNPQYY